MHDLEYRLLKDRSLSGPNAAIGVACLVVILMVLNIGIEREMWLDEYHTWLLSKSTWSDFWLFVRGDVHPPFYFGLMKLWVGLLGESKLALRSFSLLAHLAAFLLFYRFCLRVHLARSLGLVVAFYLLFAPALVYYASEARMYSVAVALAVLVLWSLSKVVVRNDEEAFETDQRSRRLWLAVAILGSASLYLTHYTAIFFLSGAGAGWLMVQVWRKEAVKEPILWAGGTVLLVAPWLPVMIHQRSRKMAMNAARDARLEQVADVSATNGISQWIEGVATNLASIAGIFPTSNPVLLAALASPIVLAVGIGCWCAMKKDRWATIAIAIICFMVLGTVVLGGSVARRYLLLTAPAFAILIGRGLELLLMVGRKRTARILSFALIVVILAGAVRTSSRTYDAKIEPVVAAVKESSAPDDLLVFSSAYGQVPFEYHADRMGLDRKMTGFPMSIYEWWEAQPFKGWGTLPVSNEETARFVKSLPPSDVWLLDFESGYQDPEGHLIDWLGRCRDLKEFTPDLSAPLTFRLFRARLTDPSACSLS